VRSEAWRQRGLSGRALRVHDRLRRARRLANGGQGHYWFNDFVKLGLTANTNEEADNDSSLLAGDT
jgi:hypothetical protein